MSEKFKLATTYSPLETLTNMKGGTTVLIPTAKIEPYYSAEPKGRVSTDRKVLNETSERVLKVQRDEMRLKRREEAFNQALEVCRDHGLNWRTNIQPIIKKNEAMYDKLSRKIK